MSNTQFGYASNGPPAKPAVPPPPPPPSPSVNQGPNKYPKTQPYQAPLPGLKIIDLGEISPEKFNSIFDEITKLWAKDIAPALEDKKSATFKDQFKSDITNVAYRVGSKQILTLTKSFFLQYIRKSCSEESKIRAFSELLDTEIGTALMAMFIGYAASQIPQLANSAKMSRVLKEFRVGGMTTIGNSAVEALVLSMLPVISSALQNIEKETVVSTENNELSDLESELVIEEEKKTAPLLRQS